MGAIFKQLKKYGRKTKMDKGKFYTYCGFT